MLPGNLDAVTIDKVGIPFTGIKNRAFQSIVDNAGAQVGHILWDILGFYHTRTDPDIALVHCPVEKCRR